MDVVIPAHNEDASVGAVVRKLCGEPRRLRCVVVANGSSDRTAEVARAAGGDLVLETSRAGKAHALNLGDERCVTFPRAYVDADIGIDADGLLRLGSALAKTGALLAVPGVRLRTEDASWLVRRYLAAWQQLPAVRTNGAGRGVYVLSEEGHTRTFPLPENLIADDGYVERRIGPAQRVVVGEVEVTVTPVRTIAAMVRRRIRVVAGNRQLAELGLPAASGAAGGGALTRLVRERKVRLLDAAVFAGVSLVVRGLDAIRRARRQRVAWGTTR